MTVDRGNRSADKYKPALLSLYAPQIRHGLPWDRTHAFIAWSWHLSAGDISGPMTVF